MKIVKLKTRVFECEGDKGGGKVSVKHLEPGEVFDIVDAVMSQRVEYIKDKDGQLIPTFISENNPGHDREETMVKAIAGWENFYDEDDNVLECTDENKIIALRKIEGFAGFIARCRMKLAVDVLEEQRAQRKN